MERDEDEIHERDERVRFDSVLTMDEEREAMRFEVNESMLLADGLEDALIGYVRGPSISPVALYDERKMVQMAEEKGMSYMEAIEYIEKNILTADGGKHRPVFAYLFES